MKIQELLDKVGESDIGLYELTFFSLELRDMNNKKLSIENMKVDGDNKKIIIKVK